MVMPGDVTLISIGIIASLLVAWHNLFAVWPVILRPLIVELPFKQRSQLSINQYKMRSGQRQTDLYGQQPGVPSLSTGWPRCWKRIRNRGVTRCPHLLTRYGNATRPSAR